MGTTSLTTIYRVLRKDELLVEGTLRHVLIETNGLVERKQSTKTTIPSWMRERLAPYVS